MIDTTQPGAAPFVEIDEEQTTSEGGIVTWAQETAGAAVDRVGDLVQWWVDEVQETVPAQIQVNAPGANPQIDLTPLAVALTLVGVGGIAAYLVKK